MKKIVFLLVVPLLACSGIASASLTDGPIALSDSEVQQLSSDTTNNACAATLSPALTLHIPIVSYNNQYYQADFQYDFNTQSVVFLDGQPVSNLSLFTGCSPAIVIGAALCLPAVTYNGGYYWASLTNTTGYNFIVTGDGPNNTGGGLEVNVQAALSSIATKGLTQDFTISGSYRGYQATGSGVETVTPGQATTLNGAPVLSETEAYNATIVVANRNVTISESDVAYLDPANYNFVVVDDSSYSSYSGSITYYTTYTTVAYPTTVQAGACGLAETTKLYSDPSMASQIGTGTLSYSVAADGLSTSTLLVTFVSDEYDMNNTHTVEETVVYRVDTSGNGSLVSGGRVNYGGNPNSSEGTTPYDITFTFE